MRRRPWLMIVCLIARLAVPGTILAASAATGGPPQLACPTASAQTSCLPQRVGSDLLDRSAQHGLSAGSLIALAAAAPPPVRAARYAPATRLVDHVRRWQRRALRRAGDDPPA